MRVFRNPFYLMAGVYLTLDVVALAAMALVTAGVMAPIPDLVWMRIHLLTIGVVVQAILGSAPTIVAARLGVRPLGRTMNAVLWLLVNVSFAVLLYAMPQGLSRLAAVAAGGIFLAIALMLASLHRAGACPPVGARAGLSFFVAGPMFFLIGIYMAASMLLGWPAPGHFFGQLEAHVHANVWGFLALIVADFLLEHIPAAIGQPLRWPRLVPATALLLIVGALGLVSGPWLGVLPLTMLGIVLYVTGTALLVANLAATVAAGRHWTPNVGHLLVAYLWMLVPAVIAPIILGITGKLPTGAVEAAAVSGLVAGWVLQIVLGALPLRLRSLRPDAARWDGWWGSVALLNLGVLVIWVSAFVSSTDGATWLTVAGYGAVTLASLPPLVAILRMLLTGPRHKAPDSAPASISTSTSV